MRRKSAASGANTFCPPPPTPVSDDGCPELVYSSRGRDVSFDDLGARCGRMIRRDGLCGPHADRADAAKAVRAQYEQERLAKQAEEACQKQLAADLAEKFNVGFTWENGRIWIDMYDAKDLMRLTVAEEQ